LKETYRSIDDYTARRLQIWLRRRSGKRGTGYRQNSDLHLYEKPLSLINLQLPHLALNLVQVAEEHERRDHAARNRAATRCRRWTWCGETSCFGVGAPNGLWASGGLPLCLGSVFALPHDSRGCST
jgi:hypothetical protein